MKFQTCRTALLLSLAIALGSGCNGPDQGEEAVVADAGIGKLLPDSTVKDPENPKTETRNYAIDVLLFNGAGVSTSDWQTTEQIVSGEALSYQLVNTAQLNAMSLDQITNFGVMIVPGGSGGTIYSGLTAATRLRVRQAVRDRGMGYVGFCAGAWVAVGPEAETSHTASYGMAVAKGSVLPAYYPDGNTSLIADMVEVSFANGTRRNLVWWGGPATPEWKDGVVARYENGDPAISEAWSGKGFVVISGPHPEAPQSWRATAGNDSDGLDYDIAIDMIQAALKKEPLQAF